MEKLKNLLGHIMIEYRINLWEDRYRYDSVLYEVMLNNRRFFESIKKEGIDLSVSAEKKIISKTKNHE